jgi:pimeloyl-ACP methyl ester carboxylesterase
MELFYSVEGAGPTLVWIHGWTMSHRFFQKQAPLGGKFRQVFWDLPGHGDSEKRAEGYTLADCAQALLELLERLGIESATAMAWSMGADVFWEYVRRFGAAPFSACIHLDALPWGGEDRYLPRATELAMRKDRVKAARKFTTRMFAQKPDPATLQWMVEESLKVPLEIALPLYREAAACDYRSLAQGANLPLSFWMGRQGFHADQEEELSRTFPRATLRWFEHSGHLPFWEEAELFNSLVHPA